MKLDLGAGMKRHDGFLRVDRAGQPDVRCDVRSLPFRDGTFEELRAHHILEHIERPDLIGLMNECWRVLQVGGRMDVEVPMFPYWTAIADPTHLSFFVSQTFDYFCRGQGHDEHMELYDVQPWTLLRRTRMMDGQVLQVEMEKAT